MTKMKFIEMPDSQRTNIMMNEDQFWRIIAQSLEKSNNKREQKEYIEKKLFLLPLKEILGFQLKVYQLMYDTYTSEMWCAIHLLFNGCSDDGFEYFRNWLLFRGKDSYYNAKQNPDTLLEVMEKAEKAYCYSMQYFWGVAMDTFEKRTGHFFGGYIDWDNFQPHESNHPPIELNWNDENSESIRKKICPRIWNATYNGATW